MEHAAARLTRAERRKQTEARIMAEARRVFAAVGYQRATIRSIAEAARVNPGLVIHYFGSKQELFQHAAEYTPDELVTAAPAELADSLLAALRVRLEQEPVASLSLLRSMLTHDSAAETYRGAAEARTSQIAETIPAPDARLRASLLSAIINAVITDRYLLRLTDLTNADPDDIIRLLQPCFEYLAGRLGTAVGGHRYGAGVTSTEEIRRWAIALPEVNETSHFRFKVPVFKVRGKTFLGMGKDETTAVFCISERAANEAVANDAATYEAVRRRDATKSFLGLQVQLDNITPARAQALVEEAWREQAPKKLIAEHDRPG